MNSIADKISFLLTHFFITPLDISQDVYMNSKKLSDISLEGIANGINFYFISIMEDILVDSIVLL